MNDSVFVLSIVAAIASGTTLLFATVGEILAERSGVMNLGLEGVLLIGGVSSFWAATESQNPWLGLLVGVLAGTILTLFHAVLAVSLRVNQIVSGIGLFILGSGLSAYFGELGSSPLVRRSPPPDFGPLFPEGLARLPIIGPILLGHDPLVYVSWLLVAATSFYLFRTRRGLAARSAGEDPATADAAGISVNGMRYAHVLLGGGFAGLAGAYLSIAFIGAWQQGFSGGLGWIAFAMVAFSGWRPWRALFASYLFGGLTNLGLTFQLLRVPIPSDFLQMMPFVFTLLVLIVFSSNATLARKLGAPAALAKAYRRESR